MKITLTLEEGRAVLALACNYGQASPNKNNNNEQVSWGQQHLREQDALRFLRKLKSFCHKSGDFYEFGPEGAVDGWKTPEFQLHDDERNGLYFVLLAGLDSRSPLKQKAIVCDDLLWPVAVRIKVVNALKRELGLHEQKAPTVAMDEDPKESKTEENGSEKKEKTETKTS